MRLWKQWCVSNMNKWTKTKKCVCNCAKLAIERFGTEREKIIEQKEGQSVIFCVLNAHAYVYLSKNKSTLKTLYKVLRWEALFCKL